ncbi:MAG TPA: hypothetical protein VLF14_11745 [Candidatus Binatia bacterium]|nr:hypothetical protein [Candidatus Binatia bacterium]
MLNIASAFCAAASARCAAASARLAAASARDAAASTLAAFDAQAWQAEVSGGGAQQPVANVNKPPTSRGAPIVLNIVLIDTFTSLENDAFRISQTDAARKTSLAREYRLLQKGYQGLSVRAEAVDPPTTSIGDNAGITPSTSCC